MVLLVRGNTVTVCNNMQFILIEKIPNVRESCLMTWMLGRTRLQAKTLHVEQYIMCWSHYCFRKFHQS